MKFNKLSKTLSMTALTAAMAVAPAINVFAAPEDIIDTRRAPVVSLSIRWTMPGRISPPMPERLPLQCRGAAAV